MIDRAAVGAALRSARISIGLSVAAAAEQIGCSERHLRRLETSEPPLDIPRIEAICKLYGVHPVSVISAGYRLNIEIIYTTSLPDECKKLLRQVVEVFTASN